MASARIDPPRRERALQLPEPGQPSHDEVRRQLDQEQPPFVVSPFVLAEVDYFLLSRGGVTAELTFLDDLIGGAYELAKVDETDLAACREIIRDYSDIPIGLADASIVVLAERYRTRRVLTLDRRHFAALRTSRGEAFELLPIA